MADEDAKTILAIERAALERWAHGDPGGFLEASAPDVDYFDPFLDARLEGHAALTTLYESLRGRFYLDGWEMIQPRVLIAGDMAVLTFNFASVGGARTTRWNTTEVYRRRDGVWKIVHTHWSLTKPRQGEASGDNG
jgi:hypothetical protein